MKEFKEIIKNYSKFNSSTKLSNCLMLYNNNKTDREGVSGWATKEFGKYWYASPKGFVLFKDIANHNPVGNIQMLNEILCYRLAKNMNINCAEYIPASMDGKVNGLASVNFLKDGETLISAKELLGYCGKDMKAIITGLYAKSNKYNIDYEQIFYSLYSYTVFDLLTYQTDRHLKNISFIVDKNNNLRLAPLYDNEYTFFISSYIFGDFDISFKSVEEYVENYYIGTGIIPIEPLQDVERIQCFDSVAKQIVNLAQKNDECEKILKNILKNADLNRVYKELNKEGYFVDKNYELFTESVLNFSRNRVLKMYKELLTDNTKKNKGNIRWNHLQK